MEPGPSSETERIIKLGLTGQLSQTDFLPFTRRSPNDMLMELRILRAMAREYYTERVSWAVYTNEWLDSVARLVKGNRVLEVAGGRGLLQEFMKERGVQWVSTDKRPPLRRLLTSYVKRISAEKAVRKIEHDVVFYSWWPYGSQGDFDIWSYCKETGTPLIIVGEGQGGCTGSLKFWEDAEPFEIVPAREISGFQDVPQWFGINDYTSVFIPENCSALQLRGLAGIRR